MTLRERLRIAAPGLLFVLAIMIAWTFGYIGIWSRLEIDLEGKIAARQDFPQTRYTHGPTTLYQLQRNDGSIVEYTATRNDPSLPRTLPVGATIAKRKWELSYVVNGERIDDFPLTSYAIMLAVGFVFFLAGLALLGRERFYSGRADRR